MVRNMADGACIAHLDAECSEDYCPICLLDERDRLRKLVSRAHEYIEGCSFGDGMELAKEMADERRSWENI